MSNYITPKYRIMQTREDTYVVQKENICTDTTRTWYGKKVTNKVVTWKIQQEYDPNLKGYTMFGEITGGFVDKHFKTVKSAETYINKKLKEHRKQWELDRLPLLRFVKEYP